MMRAPGTGHNHGQQPEARGTALIGTFAAHVLLDGADLANARDGFGGDRRIAALGNLEELASQVAPAKGNCDPLRGHLLVRGLTQIRGRHPYSIVRNIPYVILFLATDATQPHVGFCLQEKGRSAAHRSRAVGYAETIAKTPRPYRQLRLRRRRADVL